MPFQELLPSLEPQIAQLVARHKEASARIDWSYHDFLPLEAYHADPRRHPPLSEVAYTAVEVALLTEVNLPWYTVALHEGFHGSHGSFPEFVRIWTSEEDQHSTLLETYLLLTDNGDHGERGRLRKAVLASGWEHNLLGTFDAVAYTAVQEMATRAFYIHAARVCEPEDPGLAQALRRIAKDETLHYAFYRDVVKAQLEADPNYILTLAKVMFEFQMPGSVMPDFQQRSEYLAAHHVFGPEHFYRDVVEVVMSYWEVDRLEPQDAEARRALRRLRTYRAALKRLADRSTRGASVVAAGVEEEAP